MARFSSVYKNRFPTARVVSGENTYEKGMLFTNQALGPGFSHTLFNLDIDSTSGVLTIPGGFNINKVAAGATYVDKLTLGNGDIENVIVTQPRNEYFLRAFEGINNIISVQKLNAKNILQQVKNAPQYLSQNDKAVCYKIITYNPFNHRTIVITLIESPEASYVLEDGVTLHRINANPISVGFSELWEKDGEDYISNITDLFQYGVEDIFTVRPRRVRLNKTFNTKLFHDYYMQTVPNSEGFGNKNFIFTQKNTSIAENDEFIPDNSDEGFRVQSIDFINLPEIFIQDDYDDKNKNHYVGALIELYPEEFENIYQPEGSLITNNSWNTTLISRHIIEVTSIDPDSGIFNAVGDFKTISVGKYMVSGNLSGRLNFRYLTSEETDVKLELTTTLSDLGKWTSDKADNYKIGNFSKVFKLNKFIGYHNITGEEDYNYPQRLSTLDLRRRGMLLTGLGIRLKKLEDPETLLFNQPWFTINESQSTLYGKYNSHFSTVGVDYLEGSSKIKLNLINGKLSGEGIFDLFNIPPIRNIQDSSDYLVNRFSIVDVFKEHKVDSDTVYIPDLIKDSVKKYLTKGQTIRVAANCEVDVPLAYDTTLKNFRSDVDLNNYYSSSSTNYSAVFVLDYTWTGQEWKFSFIDTSYTPENSVGKEYLFPSFSTPAFFELVSLGSSTGLDTYPFVLSDTVKLNTLTYLDVINNVDKIQETELSYKPYADNSVSAVVLDSLEGPIHNYNKGSDILKLDLEETLSDILNTNQSANNFKKLNNTQFGAFELPPKKLNPALAVRWGYNMLDPTPYNFICEDIPGSDAFIFTGVLTQFNGQTVLNPIVNTDVDLAIYFNGDFGTIANAPEAKTIERYFTTIKEMVEVLNSSTKNIFTDGFKLLTSGTNFVVDSVESSDEEYTYTTDKALIEDTEGVVQIGYYKITQLESDTGPTPRYLQLKVSYSSPDGEWNILKEFTVNETHDLIGKGLPITVPFKSPVENLLLKVELINTDPRLRIDIPSSAESEMITKYAVKAYQDVAIPFVKTAAQAQAKLENYDLGTALGITYWKSRLVLWGVENADDVLFLSDPNAPDYFPYPTGIDIFEENIKHAIRYGDSLIVFTDTKLWRLDMNADGLSWTKSLLQQNIRIDDKDIPYITIIKNMLFFKSDKQFYMLVPQRSGVEGELTIAPISRNIEDFLDKPFDYILEILSIPYPEINKKDKTPMEYLVKYGVHIEQNKVFVDWWFDIKAWRNNEVILSNREIVDNLEGGEFWLIQLVYDTQLYSWTLRFHTLPSIGEFISDAASSNTDYISLIYTPTLLKENGKEVFEGYNEPTYGVSISNRGATPDKNYMEFNIVNSKLLNPEYKRVQFLDTGYKEVASPIIKKQFREIQISFEPRSSDVGFKPIMEANIDGHEVLPMTTPKIETELIDGVNIIKITEDINYQNINSLEHASQFTVDGELSNTFILDSTTLEGVKYIKVRKAINGKGYLIRLKFANVTEADYRISGHNFVYRSKNAR